MPTSYITTADSLIIKKDNNKTLFFYSLPFIVPIVICILLYYMQVFPTFLVLIILWLSYTFIFKFLKHEPVIWKDITIQKKENGVTINNKLIAADKLLFLSIREKDNYKIIRLELVRKQILFANEYILCSNVDSLEDGIHICKKLKQYIHPALKINQIKIGSGGASAANPDGNKNENLEEWYFVEDDY